MIIIKINNKMIMDAFGKLCIITLFFIKITSAVISSGTYNPYPNLPFDDAPINGGVSNILPGMPVNQVPAPCSTTLEVMAGMTFTIASPGYPNAYAPFTSCQWNFFTRASASLLVDCQSFQLPPATECANSAFLAIDPGDRQYLWYCGNSGPKNVVSKANTLSLFFWASWQNPSSYQGFYCTVRTNSLPPPPSGGGSCRCGRRQPRNRIIGGEEAGLHEFPWTALVKPPQGLCGGALINEKFVLTAAHCIDKSALPNGALPTVVLGEHRISTKDETPYTIELKASAVWPHEKYNRGQGVSIKDYDIGLVELERAVDLTATPNIAPACAPNPLKSYDNVSVIVAGWGYTSFPTGQRSDVLMKAELKTIPLSKCKTDYQAGIISNQMICAFAQGKDACFDDSGGPLITQEGDNWVVIGIVSFGPETCAHPSISGVYTRVADYISWIVSKIGNARTCPP